MPMDTNTRSTFELAGELWKWRKWVFILGFIVMFSAVVTTILNLPQLFRSTATVLVGQDNVSDSFVKSSVTSDLGTRLQAIRYAVLSRARLQELISTFDLYPELREEVPFEVVLERMRKDIQFKVENTPQQWGPGDTIAFSLSYQGFDPKLVAQVTNTLVYSYVEENKRIRKEQASATTRFLKQQLDDAGIELEYQQQSEDQYKIANTGSEEKGMALEQLSLLKQELATLQSRFTEKYPDVIRLKNQIARMEREIKQKSDGNNGSSNMGMNLAQASKERYLSLLARYEDAQLAEVLEQQGGAQFRILEEAVPSDIPVEPQSLRLVLMGFVMSVVFAVGLVVLVEQLDTTFHSARELKEFTKVPILVTIPRIQTTSDRIRHWLWASFISVIAVLGIVLIIQASYLFSEGNKQVVWILAERGI